MYDVAVSIDGTVIPVIESMRDLGVLVTKDLSSSMHVNDVVSKANWCHIAYFCVLRHQFINARCCYIHQTYC